MKIVDNLYERYLNYIFKKKNKKKNVYFAPNSICDRECTFEGNNYVAGNLSNCSLGRNSYVHEGSNLRKVKVGRYCSIGKSVNISLFEHPIEMVSTSPCFYRKDFCLPTYALDNYYEDLKILYDEYSVVIGNDVWIGDNVSIKSGVTIGDGAVVGTGAIVTKDVEPYAIVVGIPAKKVRYRFTEKQREALLSIKWWEKDDVWLRKYSNLFIDIETFIDTVK